MAQRRSRILGAVIAGGRSLRFGSDKALCLIDGRTMLDRVLDRLRPQVDSVVVCGRSWGDELTLPDLRTGRIGPLGGLEAALDYAERAHFDAILTVPVDTLPLPDDLVRRLGGNGPAIFEDQHLIGFWQIRYLAPLEVYLSTGRRDVGGWARSAGARRVAEPMGLTNVNRPADCMRLDLLAVRLNSEGLASFGLPSSQSPVLGLSRSHGL